MTQIIVDVSAECWPGIVAEVAAAVGRRAAAVREDVYGVILREIPQLPDDKPLLALLASSVGSNVDTCLQIMQHRIDLAAVAAPAAAVEYARRLAQRGTPLTALLRAYRVGHARFSDWLLRELAEQVGDAKMISAATLGMSGIVAGYIDQTSEEVVTAYTRERENWLRNRSAARTARIRDLLSGERIDASAAEATLGYRLRQYHVGLVCWVGDAAGTADEISRLEHAVSHVAAQVACSGDPVFLPRDESSAWAWLPLGIRDTFDAATASTAGLDGDVHFAFGDAAKGLSSTGSASPRRALAGRWASTSMTWNSRCEPPNGWGRQCCSRTRPRCTAAYVPTGIRRPRPGRPCALACPSAYPPECVRIRRWTWMIPQSPS